MHLRLCNRRIRMFANDPSDPRHHHVLTSCKDAEHTPRICCILGLSKRHTVHHDRCICPEHSMLWILSGNGARLQERIAQHSIIGNILLQLLCGTTGNRDKACTDLTKQRPTAR